MDVIFHILSLYFLCIKYYTLCVWHYVLMFKIPNENVNTKMWWEFMGFVFKLYKKNKISSIGELHLPSKNEGLCSTFSATKI
jgi:hypothetical protein